MNTTRLSLVLALALGCNARAGGGFFVDPDATAGGNDAVAPGSDVTAGSNDAVAPGKDVPPVGADVPATGEDVPATPCTGDMSCGSGRFCDNGTCRAQVCAPNAAMCANGTTISVCDPRGSARVEMACPGGAACADGRCQSPRVCEPGATMCEGASARRVCTADGTAFMTVACASGEQCTGGTCVATQVCVPGAAICEGATRRVCNSAGTGYANTACPSAPNAAAACQDGRCIATCNTGFANCDNNPANGCEANLGTSTTHCGACGNACNTGQSCTSGVCAGGPPPTGGYTRSTPSIAWTSACTLPGAQNILPTVDDQAVMVALPFTFRYWGRNVVNAFVSSNGNLNFEASDNSTAGAMPNTAAPNAVVAPWWVDLITSTSGVCYATTGAAPARTFIVQWDGAVNYSGRTGPITFQVRLAETTGVIDFVYNSLVPPPAGYLPTVGLENWDGTQAVSICNGGDADAGVCMAVSASTRFRFTPN